MNRQKVTLAVLLALFACSVVYSFLRMPKQERVDKLTYKSGKTAEPSKNAKANTADEYRVRLDLLERGVSAAPTGGKNIFKPLFDAGTGVKKLSIPLPPPPPPRQSKLLLHQFSHHQCL